MVLSTRQLRTYKIQTLELSAVSNSYFLTVHITLLAFKHPWTTLRQTWKILIKQLIKHTTPLKYYQNTYETPNSNKCFKMKLGLDPCKFSFFTPSQPLAQSGCCKITAHPLTFYLRL